LSFEYPIGGMIHDATQRRMRMAFSRETLRDWQLNRLNLLLAEILPGNRFYAEKFSELPRRFNSLDDLARVPFTSKTELAGDPATGLAPNLTYPVEHYSRYHRTSGTRGQPIGVLDGTTDWQWWIDTWQYVLDAADIRSGDRILMAFSFGPFIGFWSAHDAVIARGALVAPTGGLSSLARLDLIRSLQCTVVFCTPSYAWHLARIAAESSIDLARSSVRVLVVAGEPGGSIPSLRGQIESAWGATVIDHCGATEVGPWGFADSQRRGVVVNEAEFIAEFLPVAGRATDDDTPRELVLTALGRGGAPVIRYRTGDLVRPIQQEENAACRWVLLEGGILGRTDDMILVRGVNIYPTSVEQIVREFPEVDEFRLVVRQAGALDQLAVEVEDARNQPGRIAERLRDRLGLSVQVINVPPGSLPRNEFKARRLVDLRPKSPGQP
jgi:phenylacetate-CoA ligase